MREIIPVLVVTYLSCSEETLREEGHVCVICFTWQPSPKETIFLTLLCSYKKVSLRCTCWYSENKGAGILSAETLSSSLLFPFATDACPLNGSLPCIEKARE